MVTRPGVRVGDIADRTYSEPAAHAVDNGAESFERSFPAGAVRRDVDVSVWFAEPGKYRHRALTTSETAYIESGSGRFHLDGYGSFELRPRALFFIPAGAKGHFEVTETLRALVILPLTTEFVDAADAHP